MTCPECEYNKARASLWRNAAYEAGSTPLPWNPDEVLKKAVLAEREACAKLCDDIAAEYKRAEDGEARFASQWCAKTIRSRT